MKTKDITKELYFKRMKETTKEIYNRLVKEIDKKYKDKDIKKEIMILTKRRSNKLLSRPFILRMGYEVAGGTNWKETTSLGILLELENISTYQSNAVFDDKYGLADTTLSKINQTISSFLTRNLIQDIIDKEIATKYGSDNARKISQAITNIDVSNYTGQFIEINSLSVNNFNLNMSLREYLKLYLRVKYLYGGVWIKECLNSGVIIANKGNIGELDILKKFGELCGTPYTIINDISDFCIMNVERGFKVSIQDQFKDVWNGRITLPLYYALSKYSKATQKEKNFLRNALNGKEKKTIINMKKILKILIRSNALNYSYSIMNYLRRKAKLKLKELPKSKERDFILMLNSAIRTNKFVSELRKQGMKLIDLDSETISFLDDFDKNVINMRG